MISIEASKRKPYSNPLIFFILLLAVIVLFEKGNLLLAQQDFNATEHGTGMTRESVYGLDERGEEGQGIGEDKIALSDKDREALYKIVEAEATTEDIIGRIMVANVVFNRVKSNQFPDSVYEVIHQRIHGRAQFSPIADKRYYTVEVSPETIEAVDRAIQGEVHTEEALFFMARSMASQANVAWFDNQLSLTERHGIHEFFMY